MRVALVEVVTCTKWESRGATMRVALEEVVPRETQEGAGREEQKESCREMRGRGRDAQKEIPRGCK